MKIYLADHVKFVLGLALNTKNNLQAPGSSFTGSFPLINFKKWLIKVRVKKL